MKHLMKTASIAFIALVGATGVAMAQAPAPTPAPTTPPAAVPKTATPPAAAKQKGTPPPKKATTTEGIECSAQADAKGLKGKERRSFRRKCIADIKKAAGPKAAPVTPTAPTPAKK